MSVARSVPGLRRGVLWRPAAVLALLLITALAFSGVAASLQAGLLTVLPALALAVLMLTRPYLGERALAGLRLRRRRRHRCPPLAPPGPLHARAGLARGGRLLAAALAGRAPPLAPADCS